MRFLLKKLSSLLRAGGDQGFRHGRGVQRPLYCSLAGRVIGFLLQTSDSPNLLKSSKRFTLPPRTNWPDAGPAFPYTSTEKTVWTKLLVRLGFEVQPRTQAACSRVISGSPIVRWCGVYFVHQDALERSPPIPCQGLLSARRRWCTFNWADSGIPLISLSTVILLDAPRTGLVASRSGSLFACEVILPRSWCQ